VAMARLSEDPPEPKSIRASIPQPLNDVVMRALARDPVDRYTTAAEMRAALDAAFASPLEQTGVLAIDPDETMVIPRSPEPVRESKLAKVVPPPWFGKRLAKVLVPLILIALLAWGLVAATVGPTTTKVPQFVGLSLSSAQSMAKRDRLVLHTQYAPSNTVAPNTVMRQDLLVG